MTQFKQIVLGLAVGLVFMSSLVSQAGVVVYQKSFTFMSSGALSWNIKGWSKEGLSLNTLSGYVDPNGDIYFAGSFEPNATGWYYALNTSGTDFGNQFGQRLKEGYRLKDMSVFSQNGVPQFSGIWIPADGKEHCFYFGMTDADRHSRWTELVDNRGFRVDQHVSYLENGQVRHAVTYIGSSPHRVGDFGLISDRVEHAGEDFQPQVLLVA